METAPNSELSAYPRAPAIQSLKVSPKVTDFHHTEFLRAAFITVPTSNLKVLRGFNFSKQF